MTLDDKNVLLHIAIFWIFMAAIAWQTIFGWPSDQTLAYVAAGWLVLMAVTSFYVETRSK